MNNSLILKLLVVFVIAAFSVLGIFLVVQQSKFKAEARARQRAQDLRRLKNELTEHFQGRYPATLTPKSYSNRYRSKPLYYSTGSEWYNECDRSGTWIPNFPNLPSDPSQSCQVDVGYSSYDKFPRYQYISDGLDFKILVYKLGGEICEKSEYADLVDPVRPCGSSDASWSAYTFNARDW